MYSSIALSEIADRLAGGALGAARGNSVITTWNRRLHIIHCSIIMYSPSSRVCTVVGMEDGPISTVKAAIVIM